MLNKRGYVLKRKFTLILNLQQSGLLRFIAWPIFFFSSQKTGLFLPLSENARHGGSEMDGRGVTLVLRVLTYGADLARRRWPWRAASTEGHWLTRQPKVCTNIHTRRSTALVRRGGLVTSFIQSQLAGLPPRSVMDSPISPKFKSVCYKYEDYTYKY